jgi:pyridoxal phosphate phosphatase PHOSPHO2
MAGARPLVVFDYDWSLVNENSDVYVIQQLRPALMQLFKQKQDQGWTQTMDELMKALFEDGVSVDEIKACVAAIPIQDPILEAVELAKRHDADLKILSDANTIFIQSMLEARGLLEVFSEVVTNPAHADDRGCIHVSPHQPLEKPHTCVGRFCPPNMCKGGIMQQFLQQEHYSSVLYVGDGGGDFCACARLRTGDTICARADEHDTLLKKTTKNESAAMIQARVVPWANGEQLLSTFKEVIGGEVPGASGI